MGPAATVHTHTGSPPGRMGGEGVCLTAKPAPNTVYLGQNKGALGTGQRQVRWRHHLLSHTPVPAQTALQVSLKHPSSGGFSAAAFTAVLMGEAAHHRPLPSLRAAGGLGLAGMGIPRPRPLAMI